MPTNNSDEPDYIGRVGLQPHNEAHDLELGIVREGVVLLDEHLLFAVEPAWDGL